MIRNINVNSVARGWFNWCLEQFDMLDKETQELGRSRALICDTCEFRRDNRCGKCGCFIPAKVVDPKIHCPVSKW